MTYLDTAILVKIYTDEADSEYWRALVGGRRDLCTSSLSRLEFKCALRQKIQMKFVRASQSRTVWNKFEEDLKNGLIHVMPLGADVLDEAVTIVDALAPAIQLRALDALHVATVRQVRDAVLATNDARLLAAANALGMRVI